MDPMANLIDIITQETRLRNYSPKTTKAYTTVARDLFTHFKRSLREVSRREGIIQPNDLSIRKCDQFHLS